jgi:hypothetical protein
MCEGMKAHAVGIEFSGGAAVVAPFNRVEAGFAVEALGVGQDFRYIDKPKIGSNEIYQNARIENVSIDPLLGHLPRRYRVNTSRCGFFGLRRDEGLPRRVGFRLEFPPRRRFQLGRLVQFGGIQIRAGSPYYEWPPISQMNRPLGLNQGRIDLRIGLEDDPLGPRDGRIDNRVFVQRTGLVIPSL